jgi:hypothetical protein
VQGRRKPGTCVVRATSKPVQSQTRARKAREKVAYSATAAALVVRDLGGARLSSAAARPQGVEFRNTRAALRGRCCCGWGQPRSCGWPGERWLVAGRS